jgi:hypothetical protein
MSATPSTPTTRSTEATYSNLLRQVGLDRKPGFTGGDQQRGAITGDKHLNLRIEGEPHVAQPFLGLHPTVHGDDPRPFTCQQLGKQCDPFVHFIHGRSFSWSSVGKGWPRRRNDEASWQT